LNGEGWVKSEKRKVDDDGAAEGETTARLAVHIQKQR
jgi:hypothetical protein